MAVENNKELQDYSQDHTFIFGVNLSGASFRITPLDFGDSQDGFTCVCNFNALTNKNGNGLYDIAITDNNLSKGCAIGKWLLIGGRFAYGWGDSTLSFKMSDPDGNLLESTISELDGSYHHWKNISKLNAMFTSAFKIVSEYPSAKVWETVTEFKKECKHFDSPRSSPFSTITDDSEKDIHYILSFHKDTTKLLDAYSDAKKNLEKSDDRRSKLLLNELNSDLVKAFHNIK